MADFEKILLKIVRIGAFLLVLTPLVAPEVITDGHFFPFITVKNFYFRIIAEIMIGAWGALAIINPDYRPRKNPILITFSIFIGALTLASIFGVDPYHSFWSNFERMEGLVTHLHLLGLLFVLTALFKKEYEWFYFFSVSLIVSFLVAGHGLLQSLDIVETLGNTRPYALLGNSIYLAVYLMIHLFIAIIMFYRVKIQWARILYGLSFAFNLYVLFIAASRGVFIGFGAGVSIIALGLLFSKLQWKYRVLGILTLGVLALLISLVIFFPDSSLVKNIDLLNRYTAISFDKLADDSRIKIWGIALEAFKERPLLGWGPENFIVPFATFYNPELFGNEPWFDRAHNMLLEWLVGAGIIGLVSYLGIFAAIAFTLYKLYKREALSGLVAIMFVGFFVAYIVQNAFVFDNIITYIFFVLVLAYLGFLYTPEGQPSKVLKTSRGSKSAVFYGTLVIALIVVFALNAKPILASRQIITALGSLKIIEKPEEAVLEFLKVEDYGTFGTAQAREELANTVIQISLRADKVGPSAVFLLNAAIEGLEREVEFQPLVAKYPLFLGKLYVLKYHWTGEGAEDSRRWYARAEELAPNYVQILLGQAELELTVGDAKKAIEIIDGAYSISPRSASMFYTAVSMHFIANNPDGALVIIERYADTRSDKGHGWEPEKMDTMYRHSLKVKDSSLRAEAVELLGEYSGSRTLTYHLVLARTYFEFGNLSKAREHAEIAVEIDPTQRELLLQVLD